MMVCYFCWHYLNRFSGVFRADMGLCISWEDQRCPWGQRVYKPGLYVFIETLQEEEEEDCANTTVVVLETGVLVSRVVFHKSWVLVLSIWVLTSSVTDLDWTTCCWFSVISVIHRNHCILYIINVKTYQFKTQCKGRRFNVSPLNQQKNLG